MKANYRYYKMDFERRQLAFHLTSTCEKDSGVYTVSAYNTSGFSGTEAIERYLDIVKAEAAEANKAASANAEMKDFSVEIAQFAKDDVKVKIMTKIPVAPAGRSMMDRAVWWKTTIPQRLVRAPFSLR